MDRMVLGFVVVRGHPVILSELRGDLPALDLGFWPAVSESVTSRERGNTLRGVGGGNGVGSP